MSRENSLKVTTFNQDLTKGIRIKDKGQVSGVRDRGSGGGGKLGSKLNAEGSKK